MRERLARLAVLCASVLTLAVPAAAQVYTGRIDITVTDSTGAILPGATVTISGPRDATAVSDASGEVHFLNLPPGTYVVNAKLEGFGEYINKNVPVVAGGGVPLKVALAVGGVTQSVDVTAETPGHRSEADVHVHQRRPRPNCRRSRRRAIPGSSCRRSPASSLTA